MFIPLDLDAADWVVIRSACARRAVESTNMTDKRVLWDMANTIGEMLGADTASILRWNEYYVFRDYLKIGS